MRCNLVRVSKINSLPIQLPWKVSTIYKINHMNRYPGLFVKLGGGLYLDLDVLDRIIEENRKK